MATTSTNRIRRLVRQPKMQIITILVLLAVVDLVHRPNLADRALTQLVLAIVAAVFAELAFFGGVNSSDMQSATVTGLLVGVLLAPSVSLTIVWLAAVVAIASKKLLEHAPGRHIFNPAAFGLVFSTVLFGNQVNWWGYSSPYIVVLGVGLVLLRIRRLSLPFAYLAGRAVSAVAFGGASPGFQAILLGNLFFAFIMVVEPKTSPGKRPAQWIFGAFTGVLATIGYGLTPSLDGDLTALLGANLIKPWIESFSEPITQFSSRGLQQ